MNSFGLPDDASVPVEAAPLPLAYSGAPSSSALERNVRNMLSLVGRGAQTAGQMFPQTVIPFNRAAEVAQGAAQHTPIVGRDIRPQMLVDVIRNAESGGNYQALNKERKGNTASGAYQYTDATWNGYGGYPKAILAPKEVQDRRFNEDLTQRLLKFNGDPFKVIAAHYLPAAANDPSQWNSPYKLRNTTVPSVADYIRKVVAGSPLEESFNVYMEQLKR